MSFSFYTLILPCMIFLHIVDDYYLQGKLASLKQRNWWESNYPDKLYKFDYIVALIMHAFSWSFMIMIPIIVTSTKIINRQLYNNYGMDILLIIFINTIIHAYIDNEKCNKFSISLLCDQFIHLFQILVTWIIWGLIFLK